MNKEFIIMWKGNLPITALEWTYDATAQIAFTEELEKEMAEFWKQAVKEHPKMYDGTLLCVHKAECQPEKIKLLIGYIPFSWVHYHYKKKKPMEITYGSLGFQAVIYNPKRTHMLLGQRVASSEYKPKYYAHPGGIFEKNDLPGTFTEACLREIAEETNLAVNKETFRVKAVFRDDQKISLGILVEVESKKEIDAGKEAKKLVKGNEEWEKKKLIWYPVTRLKELENKPMLEGLQVTMRERR
jgi:ADP-ribose pyrophosphatase YjhB (NUDIX family)